MKVTKIGVAPTTNPFSFEGVNGISKLYIFCHSIKEIVNVFKNDINSGSIFSYTIWISIDGRPAAVNVRFFMPNVYYNSRGFVPRQLACEVAGESGGYSY